MKATQGDVNYRQACDADCCRLCKAFEAPNGCRKVAGNISPGFTCDIGHSAADGHAYPNNRPVVGDGYKYTRDPAAARFRVGSSPYWVQGYRTQRRELVYLITDADGRWDERLGVYPTPKSAELAAEALAKRWKGKTL